MKRVLGLTLLFAVPLFAQNAADRIRVDDLKAHLFFMAADEMQGRLASDGMIRKPDQHVDRLRRQVPGLHDRDARAGEPAA